MSRPYGLCADLHAHNWTAFSHIDVEGVNSRLRQIMDEFQRCCVHAHKSGAERVFIAGDLFHVRGSLKTSVLNYINFRLRQASRLHCVEIVIMPGNHDLEDAEVTDFGDAATVLETGDDPDASIVVCHNTAIYDDERVVLIPWENTRSGLLERVQEVREELIAGDSDPADYDLLLHTGINGVITGMPDHGWAVSELDAFGFKRVFAGHYHAHRVFDLGDGRSVVSIGAMTHQTWGDVGTISGYIIVEGADFEQFQDCAPKFVNFEDVESEEDITGNYVRVRGADYDEDDINRIREALDGSGAAGVSIQAIPKNKVITRTKTTSKTVRIEQSVTDWVKKADLRNQEEVEKLALDVLSEARSLS